MLHKSLIAIILADILYLVYCSMKKGMIPLWTLFVLAFGGALFYLMTAFISEKMVRKALKDDKAFTVKAGLIKEAEMLSGILSISNGMLMYHVRKSDMGGVKLVWSADVSQVETYSMGWPATRFADGATHLWCILAAISLSLSWICTASNRRVSTSGVQTTPANGPRSGTPSGSIPARVPCPESAAMLTATLPTKITWRGNTPQKVRSPKWYLNL